MERGARQPHRPALALGACACVAIWLSAASLASCHDDVGPNCALSSECAAGKLCYAGTCAAPAKADGGAQAAAGAIGAACGVRSDCTAPGGLSCLGAANAFPDGYCSRSCASVGCPAGTTCGDLTGTAAQAQACLSSCARDADCRPGYGCCASVGGGCVPAGLCPVISGAPSPTIGAACAARSDCSSGEVCEISDVFPGGVCSRVCTPGVAASCASNAVCTNSAAGPRCLPTCASSAACRSGYACGVVSGSGAAKVCSAPGETFRACKPLLTGWTLVNGGVAGPQADPGNCARPIGTSALPTSQVQALGEHKVGEVVHFNVPAGTGSFSIVSQGASGVVDTVTVTSAGKSRVIANSVIPTLIKRPDGTLLYDDNAVPPPEGADAGVWYENLTPGTGVVTVPNTTLSLSARVNGALPAGGWTLQVNDYALECTSQANCTGGSSDGIYDLSVLTKAAAPDTGTVDLAFYLVTGSLTAAQAVGDGNVARFVSSLAVLYARAGLCLGTITFYDVQPWAKARFATGVKADDLSPCGELDQLFTLSKPGNALNFFLVDAIGQTGGSGGVIVGLDGTIPGPSSIGGTIHSGAVVNASDLGAGTGCTGPPNFTTSAATGVPLCGADFTAYLTAHEGGHWMGLYHSTEADGSLFDPLSDTPRCRCNAECVGSTKAAGCTVAGKPAPANPTYLDVEACSQGTIPDCRGGDLLMFWVIDNASVGNFSAQQGQVVRANPVVQ